MRYAAILLALLTAALWAQETKLPSNFGEGVGSGKSAQSAPLSEMFQAQIKAEWEAIKSKDKKAYGEMLADDYQMVDVDDRGERNKIQSVNDLVNTNIFNYTLFGFKLIPVHDDGALVIYEVTMQFPPKSQIKFSRVYISELWLKRDGKWKEVHYQATHVK